jgi:hypothetical protein
MLAQVRLALLDIGVIAGTFTAVSAAVAVFWRTPPMRWIRRAVSRSFGEWTQAQVHEANREHHEYVRFHLGPNGTSRALHHRIEDVERALKMHPTVVDWHAPYGDDE